MRNTLRKQDLLHLCETFVTRHAKRDFMGIEKSIDPGQPAQYAQSDQNRNFSLFADFQCIK